MYSCNQAFVQVFGCSLGYKNRKENYATPSTWIILLHSFLSSNISSLMPLASISFCITSTHIFFSRSFTFLTCFMLMNPTHQIGALHMAKPLQTVFSYLFFYRELCLSQNFSISHLISSSVTIYPKKHANLCYTHLPCMMSLYSFYILCHIIKLA